VPGASQAGARRTKRRILTTNYEPKLPLRAPAINPTQKSSLFEVPLTRFDAALGGYAPHQRSHEFCPLAAEPAVIAVVVVARLDDGRQVVEERIERSE
jgi:hypothetical protein